jgi:hypothetical protein
MSNQPPVTKAENATFEEASANLLAGLLKVTTESIKGGSDEEGTAAKLQEALEKFTTDAQASSGTAQNLISSLENTTNCARAQQNKEEDYPTIAIVPWCVVGVLVLAFGAISILYYLERKKRKDESRGTSASV